MTRRRGRSRTAARCGDCKAPIRWALYAGDWRKFDPRPIAYPATYIGAPAYVFEGSTVWRLDRLVADLMGRRECLEAEARREAFDMTWHAIHICKEPQP